MALPRAGTLNYPFGIFILDKCDVFNYFFGFAETYLFPGIKNLI